MLNGVHIRVGGQELADHFAERAKHHLARRKHYFEKAAEIALKIEELQKTADAIERGSPTQSTSTGPYSSASVGMQYDPLANFKSAEASYKNNANSHASKAAYFEYMAKHIPIEETFDLTENDLTHLELLEKYVL